MAIKIVKGCLLSALKNGEVRVIAHCANMQNTFGSGIAKSIREQFPPAYDSDCLWHHSDRKAAYSLAVIDTNKFIFNLYGQVNYGREKRQVHYGLLANAMARMARVCNEGERIGFPFNMGCFRAGGDWEVVYELIEVFFKHCDVTIYQYDRG